MVNNDAKTVTYKDIQTANEAIRTTDIKGKAYAEVNQRIKAFRMVYPTGAIMTEMVSNENGVAIFRATVYAAADCVLGQGTAYEKEGSSFINKTSYIENAETSAVGRALGMAGFGIDTSVASADEVQNAMLNQEEGLDALKVKSMTERLEDAGMDVNAVCQLYRVKSLAQMRMDQFMHLHKHFDEVKERIKK